MKPSTKTLGNKILYDLNQSIADSNGEQSEKCIFITLLTFYDMSL